jgi:exosome complex RNA-binding protein Rrp42 (RNase PH superfamily)
MMTLNGKKWMISAQVCLNYGGNIHDASVKAVTAALNNVKVPKVEQVRNASFINV